MDRYENLELDDIEVYGVGTEDGDFEIDKVVDVIKQRCYLFSGVSVTHAVPHYETILLRELEPTIICDSELVVDAAGNVPIPDLLRHPHPFVGCGVDYTRLVLRTMTESVLAMSLSDTSTSHTIGTNGWTPESVKTDIRTSSKNLNAH